MANDDKRPGQPEVPEGPAVPEPAAEAGKPGEPADGARTGEPAEAGKPAAAEQPEAAPGGADAPESDTPGTDTPEAGTPEGDTPERGEHEPAAEPGVEAAGPTGPTEPLEADGAEEAEPAAEPAAAGGKPRADARQRLKAALWPPRLSRGQLVVAVLLCSLGLGLAIQVRSTNDHNQLRGARQEDLVRILDELDSRQQRLQQEKTQLEQSLAQLENSSNQAKEAQEQTRKKAAELGILAGTVKATGPGIVLTIDDPQGQVKADMLLDTLQELRAAGAEAIQINDVRVVAGTYFTDNSSGGGVQIDGKTVMQPFRFTAVGNPQDLTPALNIPGGVVRSLEKQQARATIVQQTKVVVDALAVPKPLQYGKPAAK